MLRLALVVAAAALAAGTVLEAPDAGRHLRLEPQVEPEPRVLEQLEAHSGAGQQYVFDDVAAGQSVRIPLIESGRGRRNTGCNVPLNIYVPGFGFPTSFPPSTTDFLTVGPLREFVRAATPAFKALVDNQNPDILFGTSTATSKPNVMTNRMNSRMNTLANLVKTRITDKNGNPLKLNVRSAWLEAPVGASAFSQQALQYAGRMAVISVDPPTRTPCNGAALASLAFEAGFDWIQMFATADSSRRITDVFLRVATVPDGCGGDLDLAFMLDGSGSVGVSGWTAQLTFLGEILRNYNLGPQNTKVGVVTAHGPRIAHYSLNPNITSCPPGTLWEGNGLGCICGPDIACVGPSASASNGNAGCGDGFFATQPNGCKGVDATTCAQAPFCECSRKFFTHACTPGVGANQCSCATQFMPYDENDSFDINYKFSFTPSVVAVEKAVSLNSFPNGATHIREAIEALDMEVFNVAQGMRPASAAIPRVLISLTDGKSNPGFEPAPAVNALIAKHVELFAVCIGTCFAPELADLSSTSRNIFFVNDADALDVIVDRLAYATCSVPGGVDPGNGPVDGGVGNGEFQYFQVQCPAFARFIIVELVDRVGKSALFVSRTTTNPSFIDNDGFALFDAAPKVVRVDRSFNGGFAAVHIGVVGSDAAALNNFSLVISQEVITPRLSTTNVLDSTPAATIIIPAPTVASVQGATPSYSFSLADDFNGLFSIDAVTGAISLARVLPAAAARQYKLERTARDLTISCLFGSQTIEVSFVSAVDSIPMFGAGPFVVDVIETPGFTPAPPAPAATTTTTAPARRRHRRAVGDVVFTLMAAATDPNVIVNYELVSATPPGFFTVNVLTGAITQVADIDFETLAPAGAASAQILLTVAAANAAEPTLRSTAMVEINVVDANDPPVIDLSGLLEETVSESASVGSTVADIPVQDPDGVPMINCALGGSTAAADASLFAATPTAAGCQITTAASLLGRLGVINFQVLVTDPTNAAVQELQSVRLTVVSSNDNAPTFDMPDYSVRAAQNTPLGATLVTALVADLDASAANPVGLSCRVLAGPSSQLVQFAAMASASECVLELAQPLTGRTAPVDVTIQVTDGQLTAEAFVRVTPFVGCLTPEPACVAGFACPPATYSCACVPGSLGANAACDVDFCAQADPCQNDGTCVNTAAGATCTCVAGTTGSACEIDQNQCASAPCFAGSTCVRVSTVSSGALNSFRCACQPNRHGEFCESEDTSIDACATNPCVSGTCTRSSSQPPFGPRDSFTCACPAGVSGALCDMCTDALAFGFDDTAVPPRFCFETDPNPTRPCTRNCLNGGTCVLGRATPFGLQDVSVCQCPAGFSGDDCEVNDAGVACGTALNCFNGGTCQQVTSRGVTTFTCICPVGFAQPDCSNTNSQLGESSGSDNTAVVAGVVVGVIVLIILIAVILFVVTRRRENDVKPALFGSERHDNPTFVAPGAVGGGPAGIGALDNPMYGAGAFPGNGTYGGAPVAGGSYDVVAPGGQGGNYDVVGPGGQPTYDVAANPGAGRSGMPRSGDAGYMAVSSANGGMDSASNPMYFEGGAGEGAYGTPTGQPMNARRDLTIEKGRLRLASVSRSNPLAGGLANPTYGASAGADPAYDTATGGPTYDTASGGPSYLTVGESTS